MAKMTEERQWEIADQIARHLVEEKGLKSPNLLRTSDVPTIQEAARELGVEREVGDDYSGLIGRVNPQLCKYWAEQ